ncbi:MAG: hypothetical protein A2Z17_07190 [Gammaproteobacteria bacterium RBG_16_66_13]|nr:MAG: hypothetical protein A2Z17_07190 [Gammaproteobacteria bacterium RBG_16_66_13]
MSPSLPSGWTEGARYDGGNTRGHVALFYKVHDGSESDVTVSFSGAGASGSTNLVRMMVWRGNAPTGVLGDLSSYSNWAAQFNLGPITAITLTIAGQLLLVVGCRQNDMNSNVNGDSTNVDVLTGDSQTWAEACEWASTAGSDAGMVVGYCFTTGTPTITDKTFVNNDTGTTERPGVGFMIGFKPLVAGGLSIPVAMSTYRRQRPA